MKALSQAMGSLWDARSLMMGRLPAPMPYETRFEGHIDTKALYDAFQQVCQALPEPEAVEIRIQKEIYSVGECMRRVTYALRRAKGTMTQLPFSGLSIPRRTCRNLFGGFRITQGRSMYDRR